jgi:ligand-binding sensor domain-containing protein
MKFDLIPLTFFRQFLSVIILFLILILVTDATGQRYQAMTYTEADGLANSMVFDIVQDSSGVIWVGRRLGISSYDGTNFTNYSVTDGLRSCSYSLLANKS